MIRSKRISRIQALGGTRTKLCETVLLVSSKVQTPMQNKWRYLQEEWRKVSMIQCLNRQIPRPQITDREAIRHRALLTRSAQLHQATKKVSWCLMEEICKHRSPLLLTITQEEWLSLLNVPCTNIVMEGPFMSKSTRWKRVEVGK